MLLYSIQWLILSFILIIICIHYQFILMEYSKESESWVLASREESQSGQWSHMSIGRDKMLCYYEKEEQERNTMMKKGYIRAPRNTTQRDEFNDLYLNIYDEHRMTKKDEFTIRQDHIIKYYVGSTPDTAPRTDNSTFGCFPFDVTLTSQTS